MTSRLPAWILAWGLFAAVSAVAPPSTVALEPRLAGRLDPETAAAVERVVDSVRRDSLPVDPLVATALEGASRGVAGTAIVRAVERQAAAMRVARTGLGGATSPAELVAGAGVVMAGVAQDTLARLRQARPAGSLVIPLVVLGDLVARGVPVDVAGGTIVRVTREGVRDEELLRLRERVTADIRLGSPPREAALVRARSLLLERSPRRTVPPSPGRGEPLPGQPEPSAP